MAIAKKTWTDWAKPMWFLDVALQIRPKSAKKTQTTNLLLTSVIFVGNGHGDKSSNPGWHCLYFMQL